jgi:diguanylate cyclase (GGDEF)-like protein
MSVRLERQALLELARRAGRGIYLHLPMWVLLAIWGDLPHRLPLFFWINTAIFALMTPLRLLLLRHYPRWVVDAPHRARVTNLVPLLLQALHWGLLSALAQQWPALESLATPLLLMAVGLATAGSIFLSLSRMLRLCYPLAALLPTIVSMLLAPSAGRLLIVIMALALLTYLLQATQLVHEDYWAAATARLQLEERARSLEFLSFTDALTGIANRLNFDQSLPQAWANAVREAHPLSILLIDLDHFKRINDRYGHPFGDECLKAAAQALAEPLQRNNDMLARYGGEEFIALLFDVDAAGARVVAQRLLRSVAGVRLSCEGESVRLACSIGVTTLDPKAPISAGALVERADKALYEAKQQGRNRVVAAAAA